MAKSASSTSLASARTAVTRARHGTGFAGMARRRGGYAPFVALPELSSGRTSAAIRST
jgi:hypothetical protein